MEVVDTRRVSLENIKATQQEDTYKPILDRVLIKPINEDDFVSEAGMQIPEQYRQHSRKGTVVELGQFVIIGGVKVLLTDILKVGDKVIFGEYNCEKIILNEEELEIVRVQDIRVVQSPKGVVNA